jgi:hypothetical protein
VSGVPPYPSVPAPSAWANGPMTTSQLRDQTNGVTFLANRPAAYAQGEGVGIIGSGFQLVILPFPVFDTWGGLGTLIEPYLYYCQAPGWYLFEGYVPLAYTGPTEYEFGAAVGVTVAGTTTYYTGQLHSLASGVGPGVFVSELAQMVNTGAPGGTGDFAQLFAILPAIGGTLVSSGPVVPGLTARWVSSGSASSLSVPSPGTAPTPPNYVTTTWLNTNIRDTLNFLTNPPVFRYSYAPGSQSLASGTWPNASTISLNTATVDNFSGWNSGGNYWAAPAPGVHYVSAQVCYNQIASSAMVCAAGVSVNGTVSWGQAVRSSSALSGSIVAGMVQRFRLNQGDHVALAGFVSAGSGTATIGGATKLAIAWESR